MHTKEQWRTLEIVASNGQWLAGYCFRVWPTSWALQDKVVASFIHLFILAARPSGSWPPQPKDAIFPCHVVPQSNRIEPKLNMQCNEEIENVRCSWDSSSDVPTLRLIIL